MSRSISLDQAVVALFWWRPEEKAMRTPPFRQAWAAELRLYADAYDTCLMFKCVFLRVT